MFDSKSFKAESLEDVYSKFSQEVSELLKKVVPLVVENSGETIFYETSHDQSFFERLDNELKTIHFKVKPKPNSIPQSDDDYGILYYSGPIIQFNKCLTDNNEIVGLIVKPGIWLSRYIANMTA